MKKRKEGDILRACLQWLQCLENNGSILWVDRLNSGKIFNGKYAVRLCRPGTPDAYFVLNDYTFCWLETKIEGEGLRPEQKQFQARFNKPPKSYYFVITGLDQLTEIVNKLLNREAGSEK